MICYAMLLLFLLLLQQLAIGLFVYIFSDIFVPKLLCRCCQEWSCVDVLQILYRPVGRRTSKLMNAGTRFMFHVRTTDVRLVH